MKIVLILLSLAISLNSYSRVLNQKNIKGEWGSGGGNGLVCFTQEEIDLGGNVLNFREWVKRNNNTIPDALLPFIKSIEVFDLYEAKKRRGLSSKKPEIIEIQKGEDYYAYLDRLAKRYEGIVGQMAYIVDAGKNLIPDSNIIFHESAVSYQNDLGSVTIPDGHCVITTMAAQVNFHEFYEVHIDERLFNHPKHSLQSRATLILHELVYGIGRKYLKHKDSGPTRNIVRMLLSYHESITEGSVSKALWDLDFREENGFNIPMKNYYESSSTMLNLETQWDNFKNDILSEYDNIFHYPETQGLWLNIKQQLIKDDWETTTKKPENLFELQYLIKLGLENSKQPMAWQMFSNFLDVEIVPLYKKNVLIAINDFEAEFKDEYLESVQNGEVHDYSSTLFPILGFNLSDLKDDFDLEVTNVSFSLIQTWLNNEETRLSKLYDIFMIGYCTNSICLGPLQLNNIIPKK